MRNSFQKFYLETKYILFLPGILFKLLRNDLAKKVLTDFGVTTIASNILMQDMDKCSNF